MGASALRSHVKGQKHIQLLEICLNTPSVVDISKSDRVASPTVNETESVCVDQSTSGTSGGVVSKYLEKRAVLSAEIWWTIAQ